MDSWNYIKKFCSIPAQSPLMKTVGILGLTSIFMKTQIFTEVNGGESELTIWLSQHLTLAKSLTMGLVVVFSWKRGCAVLLVLIFKGIRYLHKPIKTFPRVIEIWIYFFLKFVHLHISYTYFKSFTISHDFYYIKTI